MGPPTVAQRIDQLEEKATYTEASMADMVSQMVDAAINEMKHSLSELLLEEKTLRRDRCLDNSIGRTYFSFS